MAGLFEQVGGSEARDACADDDHLLAVPLLRDLVGEPVPQEVEEDVRPLLVRVAVSVDCKNFSYKIYKKWEDSFWHGII